MADIVNLKSYRDKAAELRSFGPWFKRFGEKYDHSTTLSDLSEKSLYFLACPGEENAVAFYELIMGALGIGEAIKFYYLDQKEQMVVIDIHLFLIDQVRFEIMRRIGWIDRFPCEKYSILEMVLSYEKTKTRGERNPPVLSESHPEFAAYRETSVMDKEVFIRRMIPNALEIFKNNMEL